MINIIYKYKKILLSIIITLLIFMMLSIENYINPFSVLSLFMFIVCATYINKMELYNRNNFKNNVLISSIFSLMYSVGKCCYINRYNNNINIYRELFSIKSIMCFLGYLTLLYIILLIVIPWFKSLNIYNKKEVKVNKIIIKCSLIIFVCWIPYLLVYYPGFLSSDSISEIQMIVSGNFSDHHTLIHLLFCLIPYKIGMLLFNDATVAVSLITILQMITMSLIFGYVLKFLYDRKINKNILLIILIYYALLPVHAFYSITIWKDIIFGGCILLLTLELVKLFEKRVLTLKNSYSFIIVSIFTIFFRNNAIYMYVLLSIVTLILFRKQIKPILLMLLIVFSFYAIVKGPIYRLCDIKTSSSSEYIAIPLQQIGRMAYKDVKFTKYEKEMINKLIPISVLKEVYNPEIVDSIKFNEHFNSIVFEENKFDYFRLWLNLCIKNFDIASEAYLISTLGYWYPDVNYWSVYSGIDNNDLGIVEKEFLGSKVKKVVSYLTYRSFPLYGLVWSIGLCIWIIFLSMFIIFQNRNKRALYIYVPVIGVFISLMVAAPVFAEFRYLYCAYTTLPILLLSYKMIK